MKKILSAIFFLLVLVYSSFGQTWTRMQGWGLDLESIHWINDQKVVAVGENLIIYSENAGTSWTEVLQRFDRRLLDVTFATQSVGVAVGEGGAIFRTTDGGITWSNVASGTTKSLKTIIRLTESHLITAGEDGTILLSVNSGNSWSTLSSTTTLDFQDAFFINETTGYLAAESGAVFRTTNQGASWEKIQLPTPRNLNGLTFTSSLIGYVVGDQGVFLRTADGGNTWSALASNVATNLRKVAASPIDNRIIVALGDQATVIRSANSGTNFSTINLGVGITRNLRQLGYLPSTNTLLAVGQNGYIITSANAGTNWTTRQAGIRNDFTVIDHKSGVYGFVAGNSGSLYLTTNGWQSVINRSLPEPLNILGIEFWNTAFGFVTGENGKIYRTSNAGAQWANVSANTNLKIKGLHIFLPEVPYIVGEKGFIGRTFSSGNEWTFISNSNTTEDLNDITAFDLQTAFAVGNKGQILWSNNGTDWLKINSGTIEKLNFATRVDTSTAVVVGENGVILKTTDKARTWRKIETGFNHNLNSVDFFDTQTGFAAGDSGIIIITNDGGESWSRMNSTTNRDITSISVPLPTSAFAVGKDGTILSYSCVPPGSVSAISGNGTDCLGKSIYTITSLPESGSEIVWRIDGGKILSGQGTPRVEIEWTSPGRNAVLVSRSNFCGTGATSALEVQVSQTPSISTSINGEGSVCVNSNFTYSIPAQSGISYTWQVSGGEIQSGQGTSSVSILWKTAGSQRISVIATNSCGKSEEKITTIQVNKAPDQPALISGEAITPLGEFRYQTVAIPGLNYRWTISGGGKIISGQGSSSILVLWEQEGKFELAVEAQNECNFGPKRTLAVTVNVITSLEPKPTLKDLVLFPNPSDGQISIQSSDLDSFEELQVYNSLGQLIYQSGLSPGEKRHDISSLPKGVHYVYLLGRSGTLTRKILVR